MSRIIHAKEVSRKARLCTVRPRGVDTFFVDSPSGNTYIVRVLQEVHDRAVTYAGAQCNCMWGWRRDSADEFRSACCHAQAVYAHLINSEQSRTVSAWGTMEDARRQHRPVTVMGDGVVLTGRLNGTLAKNRELLHDSDAESLI